MKKKTTTEATTTSRRKPPRPQAPAAAQAPASSEPDAHHEVLLQKLGPRLRAIRESMGLSLTQAGELAGLPAATLSRIETSKMSPTFGVLARVMKAMDVDWLDVVDTSEPEKPMSMVSITRPGEGAQTGAKGARCRMLHSDVSARSLQMVVDVTGTELDAVGGAVSHGGEEFCYVLSGTLALHLDGKVKLLEPGASAFFDSRIPHAYLAADRSGTQFLMSVARTHGTGFGTVPEVQTAALPIDAAPAGKGARRR